MTTDLTTAQLDTKREALLAYFDGARSKIFGTSNWLQSYLAANGRPQAQFTIAREFDGTAQFAAYKFFVALAMKFGLKLEPIRLEEGCINFTIKFNDVISHDGKDFRYLMMDDERYHSIFRRAGVSLVRLDNFPTFSNTSGKKVPSNIGHRHFIISPSGRPALAYLALQ